MDFGHVRTVKLFICCKGSTRHRLSPSNLATKGVQPESQGCSQILVDVPSFRGGNQMGTLVTLNIGEFGGTQKKFREVHVLNLCLQCPQYCLNVISLA